MHTFTTAVCPTIPGTHLPELWHTWSVEVPRLALEYEPLLNALMALSCLYLATTNSESDLLRHRASYLEATLAEHRRGLGSMTQQTADATCFASIVLTVDAFANMRDRPLYPYEPPVNWLQMSRGISGVIQVAMALVHDYPEAKIRPVIDTTMPYAKREFLFTAANRKDWLHLLEPRDEPLNSADLGAYEDVVSYIGAFMKAYAADEHPKMLSRRLTAFAVLIQVRFMDLLRLQRPRALVLLAHYFGLACHVNQFWWIGDIPVREIQAIAVQVGPKWQDMMAWPLRVAQPSLP